MKTSTNDITGDSIDTKQPSNKYSEGWDAIWGKKEPENASKSIILSNVIQCKYCKDIIESKHTHDFVTCKCGKVSVDGGLDYLRRIGNYSAYNDLSEVTTEEDNDWFQQVREHFTWGTRGKSGVEPMQRVLLKDLTTEHIENILDTQWHIKGTDIETWFKMELKYRKGN